MRSYGIYLSLSDIFHCNNIHFGSTLIVTNSEILFFMLSNILLCVYVYQWTHIFSIFHSHNNPAMNIGMHVFFSIQCLYFIQVSSQKLLDHMVVLFLNSLKSLCTILCSSCTNLQSHQDYRSVPFCPHPHQYLSVVFLMSAI